MTDDNTNAYETEAKDAQANIAEGDAFAAAPDAETAPALDPLEVLKAEHLDLKDKYLRLAAEMDNLRRRTDREIKDTKTYATTGFARDMLSVSDNLRRALEAVTAEARAAADPGLMSLVEGVELTERAMLAAMERHGVKKLEPAGQKFDPNFHQAMFEVPNADIPNNTVVQVVQEGYSIGDRVLRPAMVGVSKGGPKAEAAPAAESAN
jgi:molecular chaperone GrpE